MTTRSRRETVRFKHPFRIKGIDRLLAPGAYEVITDEEMIEGLSFASFRRVAEMQLLAVPATSWIEAAAKARYVLNLYAAQLPPADTHHRDLVAAVLADFARLSGESTDANP